MKKFLFFSILLCLVCQFSSAQSINWGTSQAGRQQDSIAKKILEPARYVVTYAYNYLRDAKDTLSKRHGLTVLEVGDHYNCFRDYYSLKFDSLIDCIASGKADLNTVTPLALSTLRKRKLSECILLDKQANKETVFYTVLKTTYRYEETAPQLQWTILPGDSTIAGYHCSKAKTHYAGRDYMAWFSNDVAIPYGPYRFNDLPGLIFRITDTQHNFDFLLVGLEKTNRYVPIYELTKKDIVKSSRQTVRKIYKNYCADPVSALNSLEGVSIPDDVKATVNAKPYNPIELE